MRITGVVSGILAGVLAVVVTAHTEETDQLASVLLSGEDWQVVVDNLGFADGLSNDAAGNVYFCDMKGKAIYRIAPDAAKTRIAETSVSGTRLGPDGKLYAVGGGKAWVLDLASGQPQELAKGLSTNDLVVTPKGFVYLTETDKQQITLLTPSTGRASIADRGITKPNGIYLTHDKNTLLVSDDGGIHVWSFAIRSDGTLTSKKPLATMKAPVNKPIVADGDGLTTDTDGRIYVTTALGLQIFDARHAPGDPPQAQDRPAGERDLRWQRSRLPLPRLWRHGLSP